MILKIKNDDLVAKAVYRISSGTNAPDFNIIYEYLDKNSIEKALELCEEQSGDSDSLKNFERGFIKGIRACLGFFTESRKVGENVFHGKKQVSPKIV